MVLGWGRRNNNVEPTVETTNTESTSATNNITPETSQHNDDGTNKLPSPNNTQELSPDVVSTAVSGDEGSGTSTPDNNGGVNDGKSGSAINLEGDGQQQPSNNNNNTAGGEGASGNNSTAEAATPPQLFPSMSSTNNDQGTTGSWPPSTNEKSKNLKRERSVTGNNTSSSTSGGNVTRIDVYPNGESTITTPDGTTTKTMATISTTTQPSNSNDTQQQQGGGAPIFQFTSNTNAAGNSENGGNHELAQPQSGGNNNTGGTGSQQVPSTQTAALNFGKGFAPGVGAQGITTPPTVNNNPSSIGGNGGGDGGESSVYTTTTEQLNQNKPIIHWSPQSTTSTCEFIHTITSYSQKRDSGCKKAEYSSVTTDNLGNKWRLIIYVNGNGRASNHHLSLFLQVADADELPFGWNKQVRYVLTLEHPNNNNNNGQGQSSNYAKRNPDKTFKMCPKAIDWGWSQFITSDRIQQDGYVTNDTLTVRACVSVKTSTTNIDQEDSELYLKCAVEEGNAHAVTICLDQEASVNCQFKDDMYSPLHTACSANNHNDGGSNNQQSSNNNNNNNSNNGDGNGSQHQPISEESLEVLDLLLENGADVNAMNKWSETPLLIAANNGHGEAVKRLLAMDADPSLCSEAGWSALTFAAHKGYDDICGMLLDADAPVNCQVSEDLSTPLHKACAGNKEGHTNAVQLLLEGDADVHALNKWRETPLLTAANHGHTDAVDALLRYGGDPCKCTDTGWSPLSIAAYKGHDDVVKLLLGWGAPTEEDDPTLSALLQAATKGLPDTVMLLLRHGADHTVTTKKGDTALSILVEQNLIDAAVEMVTDYSVSIPRCSRDRKKVQRARLLINLRLKQMQRDGTGPYCDSSDSSDTGESDVEPDQSIVSALHDDVGSSAGVSPVTSGGGRKKKKKKKDKGIQKSIAKQEAEARAAEEALLLELEAEETAKSVSNDGGGGSSKNRKKKLKKKERERQQKAAADKAREDEELRKKELASKAKKKAELEASNNEDISASKPKAPSPVKKEKVVELNSKTVLKQKKKSDNSVGASSKKSGQNKEVSLSSQPSSSNNTTGKSKKAREVSLSKPSSGESKKSSPSTSNNNANSRNKTNNNHASKGHGANRKIPGDNPTQPRKIPGDNPIKRKIPVDNPVVPRKIPGDNPIKPRKIPGDNPKVQQSSRGQKGNATPAKAKRGWESKNQTQPSSSSTPSANQKKQQSKQNSKQPAATTNKEKPSGKKTSSRENTPAPSSVSSKTPPSVTPRPDSVSPPSKGGKHASARSDESTQSTANSTADSLPVTPTPGQKAVMTPPSNSGGGSAASASSAQSPIVASDVVGPKVPDQLSNMASPRYPSQRNNDRESADQRNSMSSPSPNNVQRGFNNAAASISSPTASSIASSPRPMAPPTPVELPAVSIYRAEKLNEIFRHCAEARTSAAPNNPLRVIDERTLRVVLYRWIIRASHGSEMFLDPVIPSWNDEAYLKEFLQRQFISEKRRPTGEDSRLNVIPSIEVLRDAGAAMAEICTTLARGVVEFRSKCEQQVPANWSDSNINVAGMEEGSNVVIEWSGKSRLSIPYGVFNSLARRYAGDRSRLMSAIFSAVRRHEIMSAIADQTDMVYHLPLQTMDCLTKGVGASLETWSDSVSAYGNNYFCAMFPDVDAAFGGLQPFAKDKGGGETILTRAGGAVVVVAPPENATSSQCIRMMVDMSVTFCGLPLSFGVVLTSDSFVTNNASLSMDDIRALDPRLVGDRKNLISFIEVIPAGCSIFSKSSCMFLLIQSEAGKLRFPAHPAAMDIIRRSMRSDIGMGNIAPVMSTFPAMQGGGPQMQIETNASFSPKSQPQFVSTPQEASVSSNPWEGGSGGGNRAAAAARGHRGRLFDLVGEEDVGEEQDINNLLPGMLDSLDMNMFGGRSTNDEVDIEAIGLGFGLNGKS